MHISWLGLASFKLESKGTTIVTDPYGPEVSDKSVRAKADIVTVSEKDNPAHDHLGGIQGDPFVIRNPGEFEISDIFVRGISPAWEEKKAGGETAKWKKDVTVFTFDLEGMRLAHLGATPHLPQGRIMEMINGVDVLFVPVGNASSLNAAAAAKAVSELTPRLVVPMYYQQKDIKLPDKLEPVSAFLKEMGEEQLKPTDRLLLKKKDLPSEENTTVAVFKV